MYRLLFLFQTLRCYGKAEDCIRIRGINQRRLFVAQISAFVVASIQIEPADAHIFHRQLRILNISTRAVRDAVGVVQLVEAG